MTKLPYVPDDPPSHRLKTLTALLTAGIAVAMVITNAYVVQRHDVYALFCFRGFMYVP